MNTYEIKQAERQERYAELAEKIQAQADQTWKHAKERSDCIPFGQPILVGHHSEGRDRRFREKIRRGYDRAMELEKKAKYYQEKASSVGHAGISSDDPDAVDKIQERLEKLERKQQQMRDANKLVRKKDIPGLVALGYTEDIAKKLLEPDFCGRLGFPDYALTNNSANIRRLKLRVKSLERTTQAESKEEEHQGYTYREDTEENRIMFIFPGKPSDAIRKILKGYGMKWSPTRGAWVRQLTANGRYSAGLIHKELSKI
jgi:hypothetical protein